MRIFIIVCALLLTACQALTPNQTIKASVETAIALSDQIDLAEKRGWIDAPTEYDLQMQILDLVIFIEDAHALNSDAGCDPMLSRQECIQSVLLDIETKLREAEQP
jgi:hypothetical protein